MDKLDNFIKGKLENEAIAFNENHWMQATRLIEAQEQEKRRRLGFWLFSGQLLGVLALLFFILWGTVSITPMPIVKREIYQCEAKQVESGFIKEEEANITENNVTDTQNESVNESKIKTLQTEASQIQNESPAALLTHKAKINTLNNTSKRIKKVKKEAKPTHKTPLVNIESPISFPSEATVELAELNKEEEQKDNEVKKVEEQKDNEVKKVAADITTQHHYGITAYLPVQYKLLDLNFTDKLGKTPVLKTKNPPLHFSLDAYAASSLYPYPTTSAKRFIGYTAGLNFALAFKKNWAIESGIGYRIRNGNFLASQESEQVKFAFGKTTQTHSLQAKAVHAIEIPLAVSFNKKKHKGILGIKYARLIGVTGSLYVRDDTPQATVINKEVSSGWIADSNFKKNNFAVFGGYYYSITNKFHLGVEVNYALGSFLSNSNTTDFYIESKPMYIDFSMRYNLINR